MKKRLFQWKTMLFKEPVRLAAVILSGEVLIALIDILCYMDLVWFLILQPFLFFYVREAGRVFARRRKRKYREGFYELLQSVMTSLQAGYSLENALHIAQRDLSGRTGRKENPILRQIRIMNRRQSMNIPVEQLFYELADETETEDIYEFSVILDIIRRTGGNMVETIRDVSGHLRGKAETVREIEILMSGRLLEKNIMLAMPFAILGYLRLTSPAYTDCFYRTLAGHLIMTVMIVITLACYHWSERIMQFDIE